MRFWKKQVSPLEGNASRSRNTQISKIQPIISHQKRANCQQYADETTVRGLTGNVIGQTEHPPSNHLLFLVLIAKRKVQKGVSGNKINAEGNQHTGTESSGSDFNALAHLTDCFRVRSRFMARVIIITYDLNAKYPYAFKV